MKFLYVLLPFCILLSCKSEQKPDTQIARPDVTGCAPATTDKDWFSANKKAPFFEHLGRLDFPITTDSDSAQLYFNQGMLLAYGFNHAEAARSFHYVTRLDSTCPMGYWGFAYVLGPNYNAGMEDDNYERAFDAIQKANELVETRGDNKEKALVSALARRYTQQPVEDRGPLDQDYSDAMKFVRDSFPDDPHIAAMYAESLMDLHPWDLYTSEGEPKEWTPEIVRTLEDVFEIDPEHPGAHHFYIHAVEASRNPERGLKSAALFDGGRVPGSGHLVHMPSHIYIRTGHYHKGTLANIEAVKADSNYFTACHAQGAYPLAYYPHNYHFMAATATLEGNKKWALIAAEEVSKKANRDLMKEEGWGTLQHFYSIPYYVMVKFGMWDEILKRNNVDVDLRYPNAVRHYARGMAFRGLGKPDAAREELKLLKETADDESMVNVTIWDMNNVYQVLQIGKRVLEAEILADEGHYEESMELLKEAVEIEDQLVYQEPPDWFFSVRHHLGAIQLESEKFEDAIATFNQDLETYPGNGWALRGLEKTYEQMGESDKGVAIADQFNEAWSTADVEIENSVFR